jgi:hypothetical protein
MTPKQNIKKAVSVLLYSFVIYYLLPFSPVALYDAAHSKEAWSYVELKDKTPGHATLNPVVANFDVHKRNHVFPEKDHVRFFVDNTLILDQQLEKVLAPPIKIAFVYLQQSNPDPTFLSFSGRGPPSDSWL